MSQSNPYQVNVPLDTRGAGNGFHALGGPGRFLKISLRAYLVLAILMTGLHLLYVVVVSRLLDGQTTLTSSIQEEGDLQDGLIGLTAIMVIIVYWATIIASIMWILRAHKNLPLLGARGMTITPGWAVGWFFVPIANYWKPYEAMKQLWQASISARDGGTGSSWKSLAVPGFMAGWWALWVISNIGGSISFRLGMRAETLDELLGIGYLDLVLAPLEIFLALMYYKIISGITEAQEKASHTVANLESATGSSGETREDQSEPRFPSSEGRFPTSESEQGFGPGSGN